MNSVIVEDDPTLIHRFLFHAENKPDALAYCFLEDGEIDRQRVSFRDLREMSTVVARIFSSVCQTQEPVLLALPNDCRFIVGFLATQLESLIAIPVYPPEGKHKRARFTSIVHSSGARVLLTSSEYIKRCSNYFSTLADDGVTVIDIDSLLNGLLLPLPQGVSDVNGTLVPGEVSTKATGLQGAESSVESYNVESYIEPSAKPDDISFVQYTSGSTGEPKGVVITHANLIENQRMIQRSFCHDESTVFGSWLPFYHDMGLVGNILQPLYLGIPCYFMAPIAFIQKPFRWLALISKYRVTTSGGPDFGYALCAKRVKDAQIASLDLTSWEVAFNGSEPVKLATITRFHAKFSSCGFSAKSMYPVYGMAEATLFISGGSRHNEPQALQIDSAELQRGRIIGAAENENSKSLVCCGDDIDRQQVCIVDPASRLPVADGSVGEIWVTGAHVAKSYFRNPELSRSTLAATFDSASDSNADQSQCKYLRTGDLGAVVSGDLYITGRLKDLIVMRGLNHHPHDIEATLQQLDASLGEYACACFTDNIGDVDFLTVVQEIAPTYAKSGSLEDLADKMCEELNQEHGLTLDSIYFVRPFTIPKTTSGKLQRSAMRSRLAENAVTPIWRYLSPRIAPLVTQNGTLEERVSYVR
ncbi:amino acid adenylation [Teredinibacter turnerae T7901]|uniref:Medium-chain-fatty-acid--[acyl-carrier-protein] ligase TtuA n=1 Tax=Teredinibacter turnerae (strain ATCC 39867 / T7901) TaxID=377629 RepID=TTUA_TERTT|nr:fatty acyl-AMP ligase [Teredinibacter turnerae]ACR14084.1 amino acid adenylation [Teredinibacter turnerae T7901]